MKKEISSIIELTLFIALFLIVIINLFVFNQEPDNFICLILILNSVSIGVTQIKDKINKLK